MTIRSQARPRIYGQKIAACVLLGVALVALTAAPASAHAVLQEADPSDRSELDEAPDRVVLRFSEPVTLPTGGLRVFDADANRVDDGTIEMEGLETVAVALPGDLPDGGYVVTWRVISADSHPVSGVLTFTVGEAAAVDDAVVAQLFGGGDAATLALGRALRALGYVFVLVAAGAVYAAVAFVRRDADQRRARGLAFGSALAGIAAALAAVPVQAAAITGDGPFAAVRAATLGEVLASGFGQATLLRVVWLAALLLFLAYRAASVPRIVAATAAVLSFLLDGHQRSQEPTWLLMAADALHLTAGALWFGGLVLLAWLVRVRSIEDDPVDAARMVARFSTAALASLAVVSVAGVAMGWALVRTLGALTTTTYGWALLAKVALVLLVVVVAAYNRGRLVPAIAARAVPAGGADGSGRVPEVDRAEADPAAGTADPAAGTVDGAAAGTAEPSPDGRSHLAWRRLRITLVAEVALLVAVLGLTGALVTIEPAAQAAGVTGPAQVVTALSDDLQVEVIVDPNEVGLNALHVFTYDETGRLALDVEELALELTYVPEDIGPFRIEPNPVGSGHWTANVDTLSLPGEWRIDVIAATGRFSEERASVTVVVSR